MEEKRRIDYDKPIEPLSRPLFKVKRVVKVKKKPKKVRRRKSATTITITNEREYDFLKYIKVIFRWGTKHSGLSRPNLEILLYLYAKGTFTRAELAEYYTTLGVMTRRKWQQWFDDGWFVVWRSSKRNVKGLYDLSSKAKIVCSKMHRMCTGEVDIPVTRRSNPLNKRRDIVVNKYYTKLFHKMNRERLSRNKEEEGE